MFKRLLPALFALTALPAGATTTFYVGDASKPAFDLAAGSLTYVNFGGYSGLLPALTLTETTTGIVFSAFLNNGSGPANLSLSGGTKLSQTSGFGGANSNIVFDLTPTTKIIGMYLSSNSFGNYCYEAPGTTSCTNGSFSLDPTPIFFGVISDTSLADFQLRRTAGGSSSVLMISSVAVSSGVSETPEPSTMALIGSGLLLIPLVARRKKRRN